MAHDVFISHSAKDRTVADAVCHGLEAARIRCWIAPRDIPGGSIWEEQIMKGIRGARVMILIMSAHANVSGPVFEEVANAAKVGTIIIPFLIEDVDLSDKFGFHLNSRHWLNALTPPLEDHIARLVGELQALIPKRAIPAQLEVLPAPPREEPQLRSAQVEFAAAPSIDRTYEPRPVTPEMESRRVGRKKGGNIGRARTFAPATEPVAEAEVTPKYEPSPDAVMPIATLAPELIAMSLESVATPSHQDNHLSEAVSALPPLGMIEEIIVNETQGASHIVLPDPDIEPEAPMPMSILVGDNAGTDQGLWQAPAEEPTVLSATHHSPGLADNHASVISLPTPPVASSSHLASLSQPRDQERASVSFTASAPFNPSATNGSRTALPPFPATNGFDAQTGFVNDSGTGRTAVLPTELRGFNWGAFFCPWAWSFTNKTYIGLITFLPLIVGGISMKPGSSILVGANWILGPIISLMMSLVLGFRGSEIAWQNRRWASVEEFKTAQEKLLVICGILLLASLALQIVFITVAAH